MKKTKVKVEVISMSNFVINNISSFIAPIFYEVLYLSIVGTFVGLIILIVRKILDKKISPKWKCIIWWILLVSLIIPIKIEIKNENINVLNISGMAEPIKQISYKSKYREIQEQFEIALQDENTNNVRKYK